MAEELFVTLAPNGQTFKCVASQLQKTPDKDPFGRALSPSQKAKFGA